MFYTFNIMKSHFFGYQERIPKPILCLLLSTSILGGCLTVKPSATKSGKNSFETFYVGEQGTQYFIKPISFKESNINEELALDVTFRYNGVLNDSATVNLSFKSSEIYKNLDSFSISNGLLDIGSADVDLLFNETDKDFFISRFSLRLSLSDLKEIYSSNSWTIKCYTTNKTSTFIPRKKSSKVIDVIRENVFSLM